jgi:hypothetical protein
VDPPPDRGDPQSLGLCRRSGFCRRLFAWAAEDMKSRNGLSHRRMFASYGGVPHLTVPDASNEVWASALFRIWI